MTYDYYNYAINIFKSIISKEVSRGDESFSGYNKPKRTPKHPSKSHAVLAREDGKTKLIRFGQQGVSGEGKSAKSDSKAEKARRKSFKARHAKNIKRGKMSAAYWANREKW
jgi:predicted ATP-dependent Lon-type protease|tara:strand:- start:8882 stop:9214 length:333 start_codon:yes stop_codon:yes gene_type:complete